MYETNGGSVIQSQTIPAGENAYLPGYTTHKDDANFLGWFNEDGTEQYDLEMWTPASNFTMSADMADENWVVRVYAKWGYKVTFVDYDGTELKVDSVEAWWSATAPEVPEREGYQFVGWDVDFSNVTEDITVTAQYKQLFTITWIDGDGNQLASDNIAEWDMPSYGWETPTKTATSDYTYTFNGNWLPEIVEVNADAEYLAQFDATPIKKSSWYSWWGGRRSVSSITNQEQHNVAPEDTQTKQEENVWKSVSEMKNTNVDTSKESFNVHQWAYKKWLTQYANAAEARMEDDLNRSEMAKISSLFATEFLDKVPDESKQYFCSQYSDMWKLDNEMKFFVTQSCELWYMWYESNWVDTLKRFRPYTSLTLAEVSTLVSRMVWWNEYSLDWKDWYKWHLYAVYEHELIDNISNPNRKVTRQEAYTMLYRLEKLMNQ